MVNKIIRKENTTFQKTEKQLFRIGELLFLFSVMLVEKQAA